MAHRLLGMKWLSVMWFVPIATRLELMRENKKMTAEEQIREVLFTMSKEFKIHRIGPDNMILEIDYDKYVSEIMQIVQSLTCEQQ